MISDHCHLLTVYTAVLRSRSFDNVFLVIIIIIVITRLITHVKSFTK